MTEETKIQETGLDPRIISILLKCNVFTIKDLLELDITILDRIRGLGRKSMFKIIHFLNVNGFIFNN